MLISLLRHPWHPWSCVLVGALSAVSTATISFLAATAPIVHAAPQPSDCYVFDNDSKQMTYVCEEEERVQSPCCRDTAGQAAVM
jgi:hypothetical protein